MGYDKQLLEKFSKDLKEPVKTNGNIPQTPEISKNVSSAGNEKSGPHKDLSASMIDSKSVTQFGIPKGQTPFFVFTSVVVLILIAIFYFMKTQKDKEVEESEKKDKE